MARRHAFNSLVRCSHRYHHLNGGGRSMANLTQQTSRRGARPRVEERHSNNASPSSPYSIPHSNNNHNPQVQSPYQYQYQQHYPSPPRAHKRTPIPIRASSDGRLRVVAHESPGHGGAPASSSIHSGGHRAAGGGGGGISGGGRGYGYFLTYHDLELALERRGLSMLRFMLGVGVTFIAGASLMWPRIKRWGAAEGTEIALTSLQAEELKEHAASLVNTLISEEETGKNIEVVMKSAIANLMKDEELKRMMTQYMAQVMVDAMSWDKVLTSGNNYVNKVLKDEASIQSAHRYFSTAAQRTAQDRDVVEAASRAIWSSIKGLFVWGNPRNNNISSSSNSNSPSSTESQAQLDPQGATQTNPPHDVLSSSTKSTISDDSERTEATNN